MKPEVTLSSEVVFSGDLLQVQVDSVCLSDGMEASREVVRHRPSVVVVPIDIDDNVLMVRQYRYAVGEFLLEAPAGLVDGEESPTESAQRELQEETGYAAKILDSLGEFWLSPGFCDELMYAYLAKGLFVSVREPDPDEDIQVEKIPLSNISDLVRGGKIRDSKTLAALFMGVFL